MRSCSRQHTRILFAKISTVPKDNGIQDIPVKGYRLKNLFLRNVRKALNFNEHTV